MKKSGDGENGIFFDWIAKGCFVLAILGMTVLLIAGFSALCCKVTVYYSCAICGGKSEHANMVIRTEDGRELGVCSDCIRKLLDNKEEEK